MASSIEKRRKVRALEAKRDKLMIARDSNKSALAVVRAELKAERSK